MSGDLKRKAESDAHDADSKKSKSQGPKKWKVTNKNWEPRTQIEVGDEGIWVTCDRGAEAKCTGELRDLFTEYTQKLYGEQAAHLGNADTSDEDAEVDIEADISRELSDMKKKPKTKPLFETVKIDIKCVLFFKTRAPIIPVDFVHRICTDAKQGVLPRRARFVKRLTPVTKIGKATEQGIEAVCAEVLAPVFHGPDAIARKFAIQPTTRNHNLLKRDAVIKQVAEAVGPAHTVDLSNPDRVIVVEIYKNVCGMSVVGADFEALKRYNLTEIWRESLGESVEENQGKGEAKKDKKKRMDVSNSAPGPAQEAGIATEDIAVDDKQSDS